MNITQRRLPKWAHHLQHHFLVALLIASIVVLIEAPGYLNWLESATLRVVTTIQTGGEVSRDFGVRSILIGDSYYESKFRQAAPLDRRELARVIKGVLDKQPSLLAIDLDLSPSPGDVDSKAQQQLEMILQQHGVQKKTPLVVIAPFPVVSEEVLKEKYEWMLRMCRAGVHFAYPNLVMSMGLVMRYPQKVPTLGIVAHSVAHSDSTPKSDLCDYVASGIEHAAFLSKLFPFRDALGATQFASQRPINQKFFASATSNGLIIESLHDLDELPPLKQKEAVFLGAAFNELDHFQTAFGIRSGTDIHAAVYFSEKAPTAPLEHWVAFILDLVFGVLAGYIFTWLWENANASALRRTAIPTSIRFWVTARGWQLAACAVLLVWLAILFWMSSWLLAQNLWGNPAPLIIGVFAKSLIASRHGLFGHTAEHSPRSRSLVGTIVANLDWLLLSPLMVWAIFAVFHH